MPGTSLAAGDRTMTKADKLLTIIGLHFLEKRLDDKLKIKTKAMLVRAVLRVQVYW